MQSSQSVILSNSRPFTTATELFQKYLILQKIKILKMVFHFKPFTTQETIDDDDLY